MLKSKYNIVVPNIESIGGIYRLECIIFGKNAWSYGGISYCLECKSTLVYAAVTEEGRIIGYCMANFVMDEAEITNIAVAEEYRRNGIATALLDKIEAELIDMGVMTLMLEVRMKNEAARAVYLSRGYIEYGVRRGYYTAPRDDALLMKKSIDKG